MEGPRRATPRRRRLEAGRSTPDSARSFEDRIRAEGSTARKITLLHRCVTQLADGHRETACRTDWTSELHDRWVAGPVRNVRSTSTLTAPIEAQLDRVVATSFALIGASLPTVAANNGPRELPFIDVDDLVGSWLHVVTGGARRSWIFASTGEAPDVDPFTGLSRAAALTVSSYVRILDLDRRFMPVLAVCAALRRASVGTAQSSSDRFVAELAPFAALGERLTDSDVWLPTSSRSRRVGVVAPFPLTDTGHGAPAAIRGTVSALSLRNDVQVVCTVGPITSETIVPTGHHIIEVPRPTHQRSWRRLRLLAGMLKGRPPWAFEWQSPEFTKEVSALIARSDVTHVEFVLLADDIPVDSQRVIVVDHDPPVASALLQLRRDPWLFRPFRVLEIQAWARAHRRAGHRATIVVVFADEDKRIVERFIRTTPVVVAPLGIILPPKALDPVGTAPLTVAFVGSYRRNPNIDAVERLVDRIMPLVWPQHPDVRLLIIGPEPPDCASSDERIVTTGLVDDVGEVLADVALFVAPIHLGHGMRVKIVEALAWGKAVVTTSRGIAGLPDGARACLVVVDDDVEFAAEVVRLLDDPDRRRRLGSAGRAWAESWLHEERIAERLENLHDLVDALAESAER